MKHPPIRRGSVFVIDDEEPICIATQRCLVEFDVAYETDGKAALEILLSDEPFDVIFLDLMMPDFNGVDIYRALATRRSNRLRRIVFFTAGSGIMTMENFLRSTTNLVIDKPASPYVLEGIVRALMSTSGSRGP
jgi:DNA-binding response OmpR family regulator